MKSKAKKFISNKLKGDKIVGFDVGAKGGTFVIEKLNDFIKFYGFEPNPVEFGTLKNDEHNHYFPLALDKTKGNRKFNITKHASFSSFLTFDNVNFEKHFGRMKDYAIWKEGMECLKKITVETDNIDNILTREKISSIDFLKLDTQGTELDILRGAEQALESKKIGVIFTEFSFIQFYKNQNMFSELDLYLRSKGYDFIDCRFYPETIPPVHSKKYDSPRFSVGGDAIYVSNIGQTNPSDVDAFKIGLLLASLGYYGIATKYLIQNNNLLDKEVKFLFAYLGNRNFKELIKSSISPKFKKVLQKLSG